MRNTEYKGNGKRGCTDTLKPILFLRSLNPNETKEISCIHTWVSRLCVATGARASDDIEREGFTFFGAEDVTHKIT